VAAIKCRRTTGSRDLPIAALRGYPRKLSIASMRMTYFAHFVAQLTLQPQSQRRAVANGERRSVHVVGENRLRCIASTRSMVS